MDSVTPPPAPTGVEIDTSGGRTLTPAPRFAGLDDDGFPVFKVTVRLRGAERVKDMRVDTLPGHTTLELEVRGPERSLSR